MIYNKIYNIQYKRNIVKCNSFPVNNISLKFFGKKKRKKKKILEITFHIRHFVSVIIAFKEVSIYSFNLIFFFPFSFSIEII